VKAQLEEFKSKNSKHLPKSCDVEVLWIFDFKQPIHKVWQLVSDTARYNRAMGLSPREEFERDGVKYVKDKLLWAEQEWVETPWTWIENNVLAIYRDYKKGSFEATVNCYTLEETPKGTRLKMYLGFKTKNAFWKFIIGVGLKKVYKRTKAFFHQFDTSNAETLQIYNKPNNCDKATLEKLRGIGKKLIRDGNSAESVDRLTDFVCFGDELLLDRIRVKQLAQEWRLDWRDVLRTAMYACRYELLTMSWDSICPHCRGVRDERTSLADVSHRAKCEACSLDFEIFDEESLEVTFRVHPSIRQVGSALYCVAEPAKKKHILFQSKVEGLGEVSVSLKLRSGTYRARVVGEKQEYLFEVTQAGESEARVNLSAPATHYTVRNPFSLYLNNTSPKAVGVVLENLTPDQLCIRPRDVFGHPEFRKLFPREYLSKELKLDLGVQVILFTDIVGSTKFYEEKGDAFAFARVKEHFTEIQEIINQSKGVWVKTIGDSVMAAFATSEAAMRAALRIQAKFPLERDDSPVRLRIVIHKGPCIAVNFNSGIDYFGTTVNLAAKMQAVVGACEIGVSKVCRDEVVPLIERLTERQTTCRVGNQVIEVSVLSLGTKEKDQIAS
jgi:class 3 adenylate cyclase